MQKQFYRQIGTLFIPIVIQNLLSAAVNSADVVMLNYVGQSAISAVSLAAQYAQMLFMFLRSGHRRKYSVRTVFWERGMGADSGGGRNRNADFFDGFCLICRGGCYDS